MEHNNFFDFPDRALAQPSLLKHRIDTGDWKPARVRPYRISLAISGAMKAQIKK